MTASPSLKKRAKKIFSILQKTYPDATCELDFKNPYQLVVSVILSAQCTDKRVNMVTPNLFKKYPSIASMAKAKAPELEALIHSTGFYRNKAKSIIGFCQAVEATYGGKIPQTMEELVALPGMGRKSANAVLGYAFGVPGIVVDTHMIRLSNRMRLTKHEDPVKIEYDLMQLIPQKEWTRFSSCMVWHGRRTCVARKPRCSQCPVAMHCPSAGLV